MPPSLKGAIEWMYDYIEPGKTLLDFGCSTGYFGEYIKKHKNATVYGVEISEDIKEAKKVLDGVYSFDLDGEWPKDVYERTYDHLFFGDVLEHVKDPGLVLEKCVPLLKKDGKIFISTPNIAHISTRLELMSGNFEYESMGILDETHLKYFTRRSLEKIIDKAGYKLEHIDYSTNDYPKQIVEKFLNKIGLQANDKFWKMTKTVEARAFQYKLIISLKSNKKEQSGSSKAPKPEIKPEQFRDDLITDLNGQIKALKMHADKQAEIIEYLSKNSAKLEEENAKLNSKMASSIEFKVKRRAKKILRK